MSHVPFITASLSAAFIFGALQSSAGLLGNIEANSSKRDATKAARSCPELTEAEKKGEYRLSAEPAGQKWAMSFVYNKSRKLEALLFIGDQAMPASGYDDLLKSFYLFTEKALRSHFGVSNDKPINTPAWGEGREAKPGAFAPMHAYAINDTALLTVGVVRNRDKSYSMAFRLSPYQKTGLGNTGADNTGGSADEWKRIPNLDTYPEGKRFLADRGLLPKPDPQPAPQPGDASGSAGSEGSEGSTPPPDTAIADAGNGKAPAPGADSGKGSGGAAAGTPGSSPQPTPSKPLVDQLPEDADLAPEERVLLLSLNHLRADNQADVAASNLRKLADAGDLRACYALASCYEQGKGVAQDKNEAARLLYKAASGGYALAMVRYGEEYNSACAALKLDEASGKRLAEQAAIDADEIASVSTRFNYAVMLRYGYGTRKDVELARLLLEELAALGDYDAAQLLKDCE